LIDYYRGDQKAGITAPDLTKIVEYADHIVKARGKRTQFTSVSKAPAKIADFGEALYKLKHPELIGDGHTLVEHDTLMASLRDQVRTSERAARLKAAQAIRHAKKRQEGLVDWRFDISGVEKKALITWAALHVQAYFQRQ
jgi:hypothetical protein